MTTAALVLAALGAGIAVLASVAMLLVSRAFVRLAYLTVVTSLAAPLIGAGLIMVEGVGSSGLMVAATVLVLAATGPVVSASTGRYLEGGRRQ